MKNIFNMLTSRLQPDEQRIREHPDKLIRITTLIIMTIIIMGHE
jgi:hypothetical protein